MHEEMHMTQTQFMNTGAREIVSFLDTTSWGSKVQTKDQAECFDDAKGSRASQSFIQDKEIKDIQDG